MGAAPGLPQTVIVAAHVLVSGPAYDLVDYLRPRVRSLGYLTHPLQPFSPVCENVTTWTEYRLGRLVRQRRSWRWRLPKSRWAELLLLGKDVVLTVVWCVCMVPRADLFIGTNVLNAAAGLVLRGLGKARRVVFYTIDYVPDRFQSRWLNRWYHWLDRFCVRHCDRTWNLSSRMVEKREAAGLPARYRARQATVPIGTDLTVVPKSPMQVERHAIVYLGGLMEKQGVHLAVEAMCEVRRRVPDARLLIIGGGPSEEALRRQVERLGLDGSVVFLGVIRDHAEVLERVSRCAVAVAPYPDTPDNFTRYTDPAKPKAYLAAGVPVVITRVPEVASLIERERCGIVVSDRPDAMADAILRLLTDDPLWLACRHQARATAQQFRWETIFDAAIRQALS